MTAEVSPRCQYSDLVVTVLVTLQEVSPKAAPNAVSAARSTEMMICCLDIRFRFVIYVHGLSESPFLDPWN